MALLLLPVVLLPILALLIALKFILFRQRSSADVDSSFPLLNPVDLQDCNIFPLAHFSRPQAQKSSHLFLLALT